MMFVGYETGEIMDTMTVTREFNDNIININSIYEQLIKHKIIKDEYKINTFKIINEMLQQVLVDIKKEIDNLNTR